jgi:anti-anti-sigma factor|tara:strand:- start:115 stop:597 length:483 start_codon:yes stop_codon:yes gene_type:complete
MSDCRISAASNEGAHVLKLEGDVRLTMCTALDHYFQSMFAEPGFVSVWVDVTEADGLDSTTLGMLAQLAIQTKERFAFRPAIFSTNPSIDRLLDTMGFNQLFERRSECCNTDSAIQEIPAVPCEAGEVKRQVLEAHRTLMSMSDDNADAFKDLVSTLERP